MKRTDIILCTLAGTIIAQLILAILQVIIFPTTNNILSLIYLCLALVLVVIYLYVKDKEK